MVRQALSEIVAALAVSGYSVLRVDEGLALG